MSTLLLASVLLIIALALASLASAPIPAVLVACAGACVTARWLV